MTRLIVGSEAMEAVVKMGCVAFCHTASQAVDPSGQAPVLLGGQPAKADALYCTASIVSREHAGNIGSCLPSHAKGTIPRVSPRGASD